MAVAVVQQEEEDGLSVAAQATAAPRGNSRAADEGTAHGCGWATWAAAVRFAGSAAGVRGAVRSMGRDCRWIRKMTVHILGAMIARVSVVGLGQGACECTWALVR